MKILANGISQHVQTMAPPGRTFGEAPATLVCLHGIGTDSLASFYFTLAKPFADAGLDVVMYDLRGHGRSDRPPAGYRLDNFVADLSGLLDALGIEGPVHLIGNSFGGTVAFTFAARYPDRVAGLVVIESEPPGETWPVKMAGNLLRATAQLGSDEANTWIAERHGAHTARLARSAAKMLHSTTVAWEVPTSRLLSPRQVASLTCPVLALYGERSDLAAQAPWLESVLPGCSTVVIPDQAHSVLVEVPDTVLDVVLPWIGDRTPALAAGAGAR
ncbi:alpha/beta fold hydrolase [Actinopolymorpha alba]|uniref:alpha/beta fold hydrolase n=1 Tax=Actinopolymorpha alba TaxID=533267 RepID=UPI0003772BC4|nr:alpha/beta hydrolase [Actinopolymorpha alba]